MFYFPILCLQFNQISRKANNMNQLETIQKFLDSMSVDLHKAFIKDLLIDANFHKEAEQIELSKGEEVFIDTLDTLSILSKEMMFSQKTFDYLTISTPEAYKKALKDIRGESERASINGFLISRDLLVDYGNMQKVISTLNLTFDYGFDSETLSKLLKEVI